jgi:DNA-binding transcriptional ArsR family regulator
MRVLSDPTRLRLLGLLQNGEMNVSTLCRRLELPQPTVSHHLGLLRSAGLVGNRRSGKQVFYFLRSPAVRRLGDGGLNITLNGIEMHIARLEQAVQYETAERQAVLV